MLSQEEINKIELATAKWEGETKDWIDRLIAERTELRAVIEKAICYLEGERTAYDALGLLRKVMK
jgi:hypothetical protein